MKNSAVEVPACMLLRLCCWTSMDRLIFAGDGFLTAFISEMKLESTFVDMIQRSGWFRLRDCERMTGSRPEDNDFNDIFSY